MFHSDSVNGSILREHTYTHKHTHTEKIHAHARTHTRTHTHTHTHTHTLCKKLWGITDDLCFWRGGWRKEGGGGTLGIYPKSKRIQQKENFELVIASRPFCSKLTEWALACGQGMTLIYDANNASYQQGKKDYEAAAYYWRPRSHHFATSRILNKVLAPYLTKWRSAEMLVLENVQGSVMPFAFNQWMNI
jgi:hypothetical protein